jgi:hypothetical protein
MSGVHWSDIEVEWIRRIAPELNQTRIYIRSECEIPQGLHRPGALAWTSPSTDMLIRPVLECGGWWAGRGAAVIVCGEWHELPCDQKQGVLLHETAHVFQHFGAWDKTEFTWLDEIIHKPGGYEKLVALCGCEDEQTSWAREQHGADFVRLGLHLQRRSGMPLHTLGLFADQYGSPNPEQCLRALASELNVGADLTTILKTPAPEEFEALFLRG